jgi:transcriptional regulator with XRE-family HTH domain
MRGIRTVLAANLRRRRAEVGLSQEALAHDAGIDRTYISSIERCRYAPSIDVLDRLAAALGVEASDLITRDPGERRSAKPPATQALRLPRQRSVARQE